MRKLLPGTAKEGEENARRNVKGMLSKSMNVRELIIIYIGKSDDDAKHLREETRKETWKWK